MRATLFDVLYLVNYPNAARCKRQTLCLSFADRMCVVTSSFEETRTRASRARVYDAVLS